MNVDTSSPRNEAVMANDSRNVTERAPKRSGWAGSSAATSALVGLAVLYTQPGAQRLGQPPFARASNRPHRHRPRPARGCDDREKGNDRTPAMAIAGAFTRHPRRAVPGREPPTRPRDLLEGRPTTRHRGRKCHPENGPCHRRFATR